MLTCIDCLKDFYGDEYKTHMSCMSEEQRYSKEGRSGWDPEKGQGNKGENRQKSWTSNLRTILAETQNIDSDVRNIVNTILDHENIPRKKPKFINFVKNIMRNRANIHAIDKTWDLFSQALKPTAQEMSQKKEEDKKEDISEDISEDAGEEKKKSKKEKKKNKSEKLDVEEENGDIEMAEDDGTKKKSKKERKKDKLKSLEEENASEETSEKENSENISKKKKKKEKEKKVSEDENKNNKRKRDETMEVDEDESSPKKSKFDWDEVITSLLMNKDGNEMKLNKLKKKCVSEFFSLNEGTHKTTEEVGAKFDKKLKKRKYRLLKDKVKLILEEEAEQPEETVPVKTATAPVVAEPKPALSFNQWEASSLGSSAQTEKFRRLMGIKTAPPPQAVQGKLGGGQRDDQKIFRDLEQGFEKARQAHFGGRCFDQ